MWAIGLVSGAAVSPGAQTTYNSENQVFCLEQYAIKKRTVNSPLITAPTYNSVILFVPQFLFLWTVCLIGALLTFHLTVTLCEQFGWFLMQRWYLSLPRGVFHSRHVTQKPSICLDQFTIKKRTVNSSSDYGSPLAVSYCSPPSFSVLREFDWLVPSLLFTWLSLYVSNLAGF